VLLAFLLVILPADVIASSEIEARTGVWSSDRQLNDESPITNLGLAVRTRGLIGTQSNYRLDIFGGSEISTKESRNFTLIREATVGIDTDRVEWTLGWQQHAWGRGDRVNPTDLLSPRDVRRLTPIDEETRFALPGVTADTHISSNLRLIALVQHFQPSRWYSESSEQQFNRVLRSQNEEWALKLDRTGSDVDWSLSYFSGMEKGRNLVLSGCTTAAQTPTPIREHAAVRSYGADFASNFATYGFRGEIARVESVDHSPILCGGRSSYTAAVIGIDQNTQNEATLGIQLFTRHYDEDVAGHPLGPPTLIALLDVMQASNYQQSRNLSGITLRYAQDIPNSNLEWETTIVSHLRIGDVSVKPLMNYHVGDMSLLKIGSEIYRGSRLSPFGLLRQNSLFFIEYVRFL
jgi:hypothetical protein